MSTVRRAGPGRRRVALALGFGLGGLAAGCASPAPTLYTLAPLPGPALGAPRRVILMREVSLARYLQRPGIVRSSADYRLDVLANDWWGEPLGAMLGRVLVADLATRLPGSTVLAESVAITTDADIAVEVSIQQFEEDASGTVVLNATFALVGRRGPSAPRSFSVSVPASPLAGAGALRGEAAVAAQVAAMSTALAQFADRIAAAIAGFRG
ncbi:MAG TPA: PqiC family protein [Acetobacteraceae bacterium]|nr:PqiC family protein [Acetobacteraceae bacterium]